MRSILTYLFILQYFSSFGQLTLETMGPENSKGARLTEASRIYADTVVKLPFWDDFAITRDRFDSLKWSITQGVVLSNSYARNAPTIYQAVFDGVDANGNAYSESSSFFNGAGDSLVSQSVDLSNIAQSRRNTLYLSFYYQIRGLGEIPEESDSLQLQFYTVDSTWVPVDINPANPNSLALTGGTSLMQFDEDSLLLFNQVIVPVQESRFLHRNFKFKFVSYTNLSGIYDSWLLDYIYLNIDREPQETTYRDRAIASQPTSPFFPYYSIPADQFAAFASVSQRAPQHIALTNLETGIFTVEFNHIIRNLNTGQVISSGSITDDLFTSVEFGRTVSGISPVDMITGNDSVVIESEFYYNTGDTLLAEDNSIGQNTYYSVDLRQNDTLRNRYTLNNHFAYDDGTAEFAAGINLLGGKLAVQFTCYEQDTLSAIDVYFPQISPTNEGETLDIVVWLDLENNEGEEVVLRRIPYTIESAGRNQYARISISDPVLLADTFYIGYVQFTDNFVGLGFDKNSPGGADKIYFNTEREWIQNERIEGSLMIRPVFEKQADFVLSDQKSPALQRTKIYPNPSDDGIFYMDQKLGEWTVTDLSGKVIRKGDGGKLSISLPSGKPGMYLLHYFNKDQKITEKLIIK